LSFFNSRSDIARCLAMRGFVTFNDQAEQYFCAAVLHPTDEDLSVGTPMLRPGNVTASAGAWGFCAG
jgi:hypothetical protein